jgi:protein-disulfide isomerase
VLEAALLSGIMAMCVLSAGQIWGPKPKTFRLATLDNAASAIPPASPPPSTVAPQPGAPRNVSFLNGALNLNTGAVPMIGAPDSRVVLVELFDYTCKSCRLLSADLKALRRKWPDTFGIITLVTPINRACNSWVKPTIQDHEGACELARLSLAFWKANPPAFAEFHDYLFTLPLPVTAAAIDTARRKAAELTGAARMDAALADSWVASQLQQNIATYARMTTQSVTMPKLLLHGSNFIEGVGESDAFISAIEQQFNLGGVPVSRSK